MSDTEAKYRPLYGDAWEQAATLEAEAKEESRPRLRTTRRGVRHQEPLQEVASRMVVAHDRIMSLLSLLDAGVAAGRRDAIARAAELYLWAANCSARQMYLIPGEYMPFYDGAIEDFEEAVRLYESLGLFANPGDSSQATWRLDFSNDSPEVAAVWNELGATYRRIQNTHLQLTLPACVARDYYVRDNSDYRIRRHEGRLIWMPRAT